MLSLDTEECLTNPCGDHAACTDTPGSFSCQCDEGYSVRLSGCTGENTNFKIRVNHHIDITSRIFSINLFQHFGASPFLKDTINGMQV